MARFPVASEPFGALLVKAQRALGDSQREIGERLGCHRGTIARWQSGDPVVLPSTIAKLAREVYPKDAALAAAIAGHGGTTLQALGIVKPPPAPPPPPAPGPPPPVVLPPAPVHPLMAETVLCAAAQAAGQPPAAVKHIVLAAFERADKVGLAVAEVVQGLKEEEPTAQGAPASSVSASLQQRKPTS